MKTYLFFGLLFIFVFSETPIFSQQPGTLDSSFNTNGIVTTAIGTSADVAMGVAVQNDGKIITSGYSLNGAHYNVVLSRYNNNGNLDNTFGSNGILVTALLDTSDNNAKALVAIQADGKIVVAATTPNGTKYDFGLVRYNSDGTIDNTFNGGGVVTTAIGSYRDEVWGIAIQSDGKIVLSGASYTGTNYHWIFALARYNTDGTLDNSFNTTGIVTTDFGVTYEANAFSIAMQSNGKIVAAGYARYNSGTNSKIALARYNSDGSLDGSFGSSGLVLTSVGAIHDEGYSVAIQPGLGGSIFVSGEAYNSTNYNFAIVCYDTLGRLNANFNTNGIVTTDFSGYNSYANSLALQADGKIVVAGGASNATILEFALARYNVNGILDNSFGSAGKVTTPLGSAGSDAWSLAIQSDEKIVAAGVSYNGLRYDFALARYLSGLAVIYNTSQPFITLSNGIVNAGQTLTINGYDFIPSGSAKLVISGNSGYQDTISLYSTSGGTFTYSYLTNISMPTGQYTINAVDSVRGIYAPVKSFVLNQAQTTSTNLKVLAPILNDTLYVNDTAQITWTDKLVLGTYYTVTGAQRNYQYTIEYSTDNGNIWNAGTSIQGSDYINSIKTFHVPVVFHAVGNSYEVRVTDFYYAANRDSSGVFNVVNQPSVNSGNVETELNWDFSYNNQNNPLYGIAADGSARIYLAVSKINNGIGVPITSVSVQISDNWNNSTTALGKVMAATQVSAYGDEANAANSLSATQSTEALSKYWFWYVAPDDFTGNDPNDSLSSYRYVNAHIIVAYSDGTFDTLNKKIKIVRPPVCFVHGLASNPSAWDNFSSTAFGYQLAFLNDPRFYTKIAIQIDPTASFNFNAQTLTVGFVNNGSNLFQNTFQGVIENLRNQGYAANRCDYIAHSMGGSVLRYALDNYSDLFYRTGSASTRDYKNYEKGYVNKVITLATPNDGSPWADILNRYVGQLSYTERFAIQEDYGLYPNALPFSFITQDQYGLFGVPTFKVVDAVKDLQIDSTQGGVKFNAENINAHLISGGIFPGVNYNSSNYMVPQQVINVVDLFAQDVDFLNDFADATIANEQDQQVVSDLIEIGNSSDNPVQTALQYVERMADFYNIAVFIPSSDLVVSKSSALEDNPVTAPNVSVFDNYVGHAFINPILSDIDAGNEVNYLLNSPISSNNFASIGASDYILPPHFTGNQRSVNTILSIRDTTVLKLMNPDNGANLATDSIIDIKVNLPDTANLISLKIRFQNKTYKLNSAPGITDLNTQVNSNLLDSNFIYVQAFYKYSDTSIFYYDSALVNVTTTSTLIGFAAQEKIMFLNINQEKFPDYVSYYQAFATSVGNFSKHITATIADNSIAAFDPTHKGFIGVSTGETYAIVTYNGLKDTIYIVVGDNPIDSITTGIKPIPNTADNSNDLKLLCYPNPFNQMLNIDFEIAITGNASLKIYDLMGREAVNLFQGRKEQGLYQTSFDGSLLPDGVYLCELRNEDMRCIKKIVVTH